MVLTDLSDAELLSHLEATCMEGQRLVARVIVFLNEVEDRRLHLRAVCSSMFDYCRRKLRMSEGEACRRIGAARLVRDFPSLLGAIERGEIHLSTLALLRGHLTEANVDELVAAASGKTRQEVQELLARRAPKPDVPARIPELPHPSATLPRMPLPSATPAALGADEHARIEPLSEARYRVQLTASRDLRDKIERATDLMRHRNPSGDLAVVVERALDALLEKLEKERLGKTTRPSRKPRAAKPARVTSAVRREVFERDGEQCTFVDAEGARCPARTLLELDHVVSRACGGSSEATNLRVMCRPHNRLHAEEVFGKKQVADRIHRRQRMAHRVGAAKRVTESEPARAEPAKGDRAPETIDVATRGLLHMGFRDRDVNRALVEISGRHAGTNGSGLEAAEWIREALRLLT